MALSVFTPAKKLKKTLKLAIFGGPGSGKTYNALVGWEGITAAVIDTEHGTDLYAARDDIPEFFVLHDKTLAGIKRALDDIRRDNGESVQMLIIDPITIFHYVLQLAARERGNRFVTRDGQISQAGWGFVRDHTMDLYNQIKNLPVHLVITARESDVYDKVEGQDRKVDEKADAHRMTPYEADIVVQLREVNGKYYCRVRKDRSRVLLQQSGHRFELTEEKPLAWHMKPVLEMLAQGVEMTEESISDLEAAKQTAKVTEQEEQAEASLEALKAELGKLCAKAGVTVKAVADWAKEARGLNEVTLENGDAWKKAIEDYAALPVEDVKPEPEPKPAPTKEEPKAEESPKEQPEPEAPKPEETEPLTDGQPTRVPGMFKVSDLLYEIPEEEEQIELTEGGVEKAEEVAESLGLPVEVVLHALYKRESITSFGARSFSTVRKAFLTAERDKIKVKYEIHDEPVPA